MKLRTFTLLVCFLGSVFYVNAQQHIEFTFKVPSACTASSSPIDNQDGTKFSVWLKSELGGAATVTFSKQDGSGAGATISVTLNADGSSFGGVGRHINNNIALTTTDTYKCVIESPTNRVGQLILSNPTSQEGGTAAAPWSVERRVISLSATNATGLKEVDLRVNSTFTTWNTANFNDLLIFLAGSTNIGPTVNLSALTNLKEFKVDACPNLTAVTFPNNGAIQKVHLMGNRGITALDLTNNTNLDELGVYDCENLTNLVFSGAGPFNKLTTLNLYNTNVRYLDVSKCTSLTALNVSKCRFTFESLELLKTHIPPSFNINNLVYVPQKQCDFTVNADKTFDVSNIVGNLTYNPAGGANTWSFADVVDPEHGVQVYLTEPAIGAFEGEWGGAGYGVPFDQYNTLNGIRIAYGAADKGFPEFYASTGADYWLPLQNPGNVGTYFVDVNPVRVSGNKFKFDTTSVCASDEMIDFGGAPWEYGQDYGLGSDPPMRVHFLSLALTSPNWPNFTTNDPRLAPIYWLFTKIQNLEVPYTGTGIKSPFVEQPSVSAFPNPFTDRLAISNAAGSQVQICDMKGRSLYTGQIKTDSDNLSLGYLPAGIYIVKVWGNGVSKALKVIKN
jgi:hypothetical protein